MKIRALYISLGHNYFGHYGKPAGTHEMMSVDKVECVAGKGIQGDRFFDYKDNYKGQVSFFSLEVYQSLCEALKLEGCEPYLTRRNILTEGVNLNDLIGKQFTVQGIEFEGREECRPCFWMDQAFAEGTEDFLKGQGGLRASVCSSGPLKVTDPL